MASRGEPTRSAVDGPGGQPSLLTMIGIVALVVAFVILVFFAIGYLFGRVFL
jgi:hypothetical protein